MENKKKQFPAIVIVVIFFLGFIIGSFSGVLYTVLHDIKTRGETNQAFIEDYIIENNTIKENTDNSTLNTEIEDSVIGVSDKDWTELNPQEVAIDNAYFISINKPDVKIEEYAISLTEKYLKTDENILPVLNTANNLLHTITKDETDSYLYIATIEYQNNGMSSNEESLFSNYEIDLNTKNIIKY